MALFLENPTTAILTQYRRETDTEFYRNESDFDNHESLEFLPMQHSSNGAFSLKSVLRDRQNT